MKNKKTITAPHMVATSVYCGPTIPGVAKSFTAFSGGLPAQLEAFCATYPAASGLIVPVPALPTVREALRHPGSPESLLYNLISNYIGGK